VLEAAQSVIFLSPAYEEQFLSRLPAALRTDVASKSLVVLNGLSDLWHEDIPVEEPRLAPELRLLFVGSFTRNKNVVRLLEAAAMVHARRPVRLTLVGGGGRDERRIRTLLQSDKFRFVHHLGRIDDPMDLRAVYREHDIFVMPSLAETFGMVYIEALSQGVPVLHARGQGVDGFYPSGGVAEAVDPRDVRAIAAGIESIATRLSAIRGQCKSSASQFTWRAIAERYAAVYTDARAPN
jgi:glycosyltransferase involved in cell wall biosynthesis